MLFLRPWAATEKGSFTPRLLPTHTRARVDGRKRSSCSGKQIARTFFSPSSFLRLVSPYGQVAGESTNQQVVLLIPPKPLFLARRFSLLLAYLLAPPTNQPLEREGVYIRGTKRFRDLVAREERELPGVVCAHCTVRKIVRGFLRLLSGFLRAPY